MCVCARGGRDNERSRSPVRFREERAEGRDGFVRCRFRISFETDGLTGIFSSGLPACKETAACRYRLSLSFDRGRWRNGKLLMFIKKCNEQLFVMKRLLYLM